MRLHGISGCCYGATGLCDIQYVSLDLGPVARRNGAPRHYIAPHSQDGLNPFGKVYEAQPKAGIKLDKDVNIARVARIAAGIRPKERQPTDAKFAH